MSRSLRFGLCAALWIFGPRAALAHDARERALDHVLASRLSFADEHALQEKCGDLISAESGDECWDAVFEAGVHQLYFQGEDTLARSGGSGTGRFLEWHRLISRTLEHGGEERAWTLLERLLRKGAAGPRHLRRAMMDLRAQLAAWEGRVAAPPPPACRVPVDRVALLRTLESWGPGADRLRRRAKSFPRRLDFHQRLSDPDDLILVLLLTPQGRRTARAMLDLRAQGKLSVHAASARERRELDDIGAGGETHDDAKGRRLIIYWGHLPLAMLAPIFLHEGTHAIDDSERVRQRWTRKLPTGEPKETLEDSVSFYRERKAWSAEEIFDRELSSEFPCVHDALSYYVRAGLNHRAHVSDRLLATLHGIDLSRVRRMERLSRRAHPLPARRG